MNRHPSARGGHRSPRSGTVRLNWAAVGVPLTVHTVDPEVGHSRCLQLGLEPGDRLRCVERTSNRVVVDRDDGPPLRIPVRFARHVRVLVES